MTDIVEQLREIVSKGSPFGQVMAEAADEIERQRRVISFKGRVDRLSGAPAQPTLEPVAWRYTCADGSVELMLKRLTDEQKRRGYYTGEDGEDEVDGDEAIVGPFYWAEETPLYAAQPPAAPVETELQARRPDGGKWINIFPAQLEWIAKEGWSVRAVEAESHSPSSADIEPVAWRHKHWPNEPWQYRDSQTFGTPYPYYEPLYNKPPVPNEPQTVSEQLRPSGPAERATSGTWTAGIDALRSYPYQDTQWHLHAIEFHHKVREEAEALRDRWLALSLSRPHGA